VNKDAFNTTLRLSKEEMQQYGYKIIDHIVDHFENQHSKKPVTIASRQEMDSLLTEDIPLQPTPANEVLDFVMEQIIPYSNIVSHPKSYSFVPGPSNYISAMADTIATGFNIFSGG